MVSSYLSDSCWGAVEHRLYSGRMLVLRGSFMLIEETVHPSSLPTGTIAPSKLSDVFGTGELFIMDAEQPLPAQGWWTSADTAGWRVEVMSG